MIRSFVFSQGKLLSRDIGLDMMKVMLADEGVHIWADLEAASEEEARALLEGVYAFHPLAIDDCMAVSELPKVDDYEHYLFMVVHAVNYRQSTHAFQTTELNFFLGRNFLVTYHDEPLRSITTTVDRLLRNAPAMAKAPDQLSYTILDALLNNYQPALDELSGELAQIERDMLANAATDFLADVLQLRGEVQHLRQIITPQREVITRIAHGEFRIVHKRLLPYFRDLADHLSRISEQAFSYRESLTNALQVHLNLQQMQINRVTKVLTVLATLSMPVLLITSFYGMNINQFPPMGEDGWPWYAAYGWFFCLTAACLFLLYRLLKRNRWL